MFDYVLYFVCSQSTMIQYANHAHGSTLTWDMIGQWLDPHISERKLKSYKSFFNNFRVGKHHLIMPDIGEAHFNVIDISIDNSSPDFITAITYYDLQSDSKNLSTNFVLFIARMVCIFNKYILSKGEACQAESVLKLIHNSCCPQQQSIIDCGLFAISVCIHTLE